MPAASAKIESAASMDAEPAALLADLESRAQRYETPCGSGTIVWRAWGSGPPVLLAHGAQGAWSHWIRTIDALAAERTVWAPDLPGYGESALAEQDDHSAISAALATGLRELVGTEAVDLVGFSFGGVVCAYLAACHPQLARRLVLIGTGGLDTPVGSVDIRPVRGLEGDERKAAHRANLLGLMLHNADAADELAVLLQEMNGFRSRLNPISFVLPDKLAAVLPQVAVPIDAIWGQCDRPHPDPALQEAVIRRFQPNMDFQVIGDAGHWVMYERPDVFNDIILTMLRRPPRATL